MNSISIQQIMEMPNAAILAERINSALAEEKEKREFFYKVIDESKKMEFINGEIVYHKPSPFCEAKAFGNLLISLSTFVSKNKLGEVTFGKIMISLSRNDYEPDICFFKSEKSKDFNGETMQFPAPDFVVEVLSPSTEAHDRETKFQDFAAHGVEEYWIVDPEAETVEQYVLRGEEYELLLKSGDGNIQSVAVEHFTIPIRSIFDEQENLRVLERMLEANNK
ncbi:MAG: Uma2 family endonuclease [Aridibacter sp.]